MVAYCWHVVVVERGCHQLSAADSRVKESQGPIAVVGLEASFLFQLERSKNVQ